MPSCQCERNAVDFSDRPIQRPSDDKFGIDSFAQTVAKCIARLPNPEGSVVAVCGPWGSGKSGAVNLIRHHLSSMAGDVTVIPFLCWKYRSKDAVAQAFLRELNTGLQPWLSESEQAKRALRQMCARVSGMGPVIGSALGATIHPSVGALVTWAWEHLSGRHESEMGDEELRSELSGVLSQQDKRILIVIDDMDRLMPDEVMTVLRLIKSIGRLPNVMYLLAYDRSVVENIVAKHSKKSSQGFLEKIVQASFELPEADQNILESILWHNLEAIVGDNVDDDEDEMWHSVTEYVMPDINTPRDVVRLLNTIAVSWGAVAGEVDISDFLVICGIHLRYPKLYRKIQTRKWDLVGTAGYPLQGDVGMSEDDWKELLPPEDYEGTPLERNNAKDLLIRLFPRVEEMVSNLKNTKANQTEWERERRICSPSHFDTYFVFAASSYALPAAELNSIFEKVTKGEDIGPTLRKLVDEKIADGRTKAACLLEDLAKHADRIDVESIQCLLSDVFRVSNCLLTRPGEHEGLISDPNLMRIDILVKALLCREPNVGRRSQILFAALQSAPPTILMTIEALARSKYKLNESGLSVASDDVLLSQDDMEKLRKQIWETLHTKKMMGTLIDEPRLVFVLAWWARNVKTDVPEIKKWCEECTQDDAKFTKFAEGLLLYLSRFLAPTINDFLDVDALKSNLGERKARKGISLFELKLVQGLEERLNMIDAESKEPD